MSGFVATAGKGGANYEKAPTGNHLARLVAIVDMGTQKQDGYQGGPATFPHRLYFVWELVTKKKAGVDANHVIGIDLTFSLNEKAKLRKWIEARIGRPIRDGENYDIAQELGQPCLLNVIEKNGHPKIEGVAAVPEGIAVPPAKNPAFSRTVADYKAAGKVDLPGWLPYFYGAPVAETIKGCPELEGTPAGAPSGGDAPPARASSAPARATQPGADPEWWVDAPGKVEVELMFQSALVAWATAGGLKPTDVNVMDKAKTGGWRTAAAAGIAFDIPF